MWIISALPVIPAQSPTRGASLENLDLGVKRRLKVEPRNACPLEVRVEKAVHAVRRNGKLATSVDVEHTEPAERPTHDTALQQGSVVTEEEMVRATDRDA